VSSHSKPTPTQVAFAGWQRMTSTGTGTWLRQPPQSRKNDSPLRDGYGQPKLEPEPKIELELPSNQTDSSKPVSANSKCTKNELPSQDGNGQLELKLLTNLTDSSKPVTYAQNQRPYKSPLQDGNGRRVWALGIRSVTRRATRTSCPCRMAMGSLNSNSSRI
jgi:hypothetical protein